MSLNLNKVVLAGRMVADPELKMTQSGIPVTSFTIAVNRRPTKNSDGQVNEVADFFDIVAWRERAEFVCRYFNKGKAICICGSLQKRMWQDQQGQKRYNVEIVADEINFVESKNDGGQAANSSQSGQYTPASYNAPAYSGGGANNAAPKFEEVKTDDDLPF